MNLLTASVQYRLALSVIMNVIFGVFFFFLRLIRIEPFSLGPALKHIMMR